MVVILPRNPVAPVLARVVQAEPAWVRGQTRLDLGCGSGVAGIAAHDIDPVALAIAAQNARANAVELLLQAPPLLHTPCPACITCILVGDLFYERSTASALWALVVHGPPAGGPGPHRGRVPPVCPHRPVCDACGRNAWLPPGPGRARMPGRCGSLPWTSETALRKRPASGLPRVQGTPRGKHAPSRQS